MPQGNAYSTIVPMSKTSPALTKIDTGSTDRSDTLANDEKRRIFVQIAAMTNGDPASTLSFCRNFIFGNEVKTTHVKGLIEKYQDEIMDASDALQAFTNSKDFEFLGIMKQAQIINTGIRTAEMQLNVAEEQILVMNNAEEERNFRRADSIARRCSMLVNQFQKWMVEKERWIIRAEQEMAKAASKDLMLKGTPGQKLTLDVQKLSIVMRRNGVIPEIADRVSGLICTGDFFISQKEKEKQGSSRYMIEEGEEIDADDTEDEDGD